MLLVPPGLNPSVLIQRGKILGFFLSINIYFGQRTDKVRNFIYKICLYAHSYVYTHICML